MKFSTLYAAFRISSRSENEYGLFKNRFDPVSVNAFGWTALLHVDPIMIILGTFSIRSKQDDIYF